MNKCYTYIDRFALTVDSATLSHDRSLAQPSTYRATIERRQRNAVREHNSLFMEVLLLIWSSTWSAVNVRLYNTWTPQQVSSATRGTSL